MVAPNFILTGLYWGGPSINRYVEAEPSYLYKENLWLDLNVSTSGSKISGTAKAYYFAIVDYENTEDDWMTIWPKSETPANEFTYSVKGTRRNGIATLNLTGLGVIKGLKATLHIDESTEEIVQNGKNSIKLYGQTVTY